MPKANLIIVEDESIVARDLETRLKNLDYKVLAIVSSGSEAIEAAGKYRPDIMLMDILLKGNLDGIRTAAEIRQLYNIPSIYLTSYSDDYIISRAKTTEPFGYILKPFSDREVHINIEIALYRNRIEKEKGYNIAVKSLRLFNLSMLENIEWVMKGPKQDITRRLEDIAKMITNFNNILGPDEGRTNIRLKEILDNVITNLEPEVQRFGLSINLTCDGGLEITASKKILEISFFMLISSLMSMSVDAKRTSAELIILVEKTDIGANISIRGGYSILLPEESRGTSNLISGEDLSKYFLENNNGSTLSVENHEDSFECTVLLK